MMAEKLGRFQVVESGEVIDVYQDGTVERLRPLTPLERELADALEGLLEGAHVNHSIGCGIFDTVDVRCICGIEAKREAAKALVLRVRGERRRRRDDGEHHRVDST